MKKFLVLTVALVSVFYYSEKANAGVHIEPLVGYVFNGEYSGEFDFEGEYSGTQLGLRVGYAMAGLSFGLDARRGSYEIKPKEGDDSDAVSTEYGLFIGYDLPVMLRFWGVYQIAGESDSDGDVLIEPSGFTLGVGYKVMPFVSLNLEYVNQKYAKIDVDGTEYDVDASFTGFVLGASFPFGL